jgi:putative ABC transport system ATP-binding protein
MIEIRDLKKIYHLGDVDVHALRGVNLLVARGEFVSVVGPSGSGKSTLFHILGGLTPPSSGEIHIDGRDLLKMTDAERTNLRKTTVGFVFQKYNLLPTLTAQENIDIAREQQRVAIARAIVNRPAILLADEPTGNLDSENSQVVLNLLRRLNDQFEQTILMITHDADAATYGHRIVHMRDGRLTD